MTRPHTTLLCLLLSVIASGCIGDVRKTTTDRTATEQLLISTAAERAVARIDAEKLKGRTVYVDVDRLECIDRGYVVSAFCEIMGLAGAHVLRNPDKADVIVEARSGVLNAYKGTWNLWFPVVIILNAAGEPEESPKVLEIGYGLREGWARIQAFAYERETGKFLFGWGDGWGYAHVGFQESIYPEKSLLGTLQERVE
ncbi:DUF6655 family protein [Planctomycetota bacterium]